MRSAKVTLNMPNPCDVMRLIILVRFTHLADIVSREVGDVEGGGWGKPLVSRVRAPYSEGREDGNLELRHFQQ